MKRTHRTALVCLLSAFACSALACSHAQEREEGAATAAPAAAPAQAPVGLTLLDAGQEPRQQLRYAFAPGQVFHTANHHRNTVKVTVTVAGQPPAEQQSTSLALHRLTHTVERVNEEGDFVLQVGLEVLSDPAGPAPSPQEVALYQALSGLSSEMVVSPRGEVRSTAWAGLDQLEPQLQQVAMQVTEASKEFNLLPEEPVGAGARWEAVSDVVSGGLTIRVVADTTVTAITPEGYEADIVLRMSLPPGEMDLPNMPAGSEVTVEAFSGTGSGTVAVELKRPAPLRSAVKSEADFAIKVLTEAQEMKIEMTMSQLVSSAPDTKPAPISPN